MSVVILQPSYIPWRGYFHQIQRAEVFVFYDDVQYDKHGWRNRNRIKGPGGSQWLTIPVLSKGATVKRLPIAEVRIRSDVNWAAKHWRTIAQNYAKAPFFRRYAPLLEPLYQEPPELLADFNIELTLCMASELGLGATRFARSSELGISGSKTGRLVSIVEHFGSSRYISGPSAKDYLDEDAFAAAGISVEYMDYSYPDYPQLHPPFDPQVSALDLLFMVGPEAPEYIWGATAAADGTSA